MHIPDPGKQEAEHLQLGIQYTYFCLPPEFPKGPNLVGQLQKFPKMHLTSNINQHVRDSECRSLPRIPWFTYVVGNLNFETTFRFQIPHLRFCQFLQYLSTQESRASAPTPSREEAERAASKMSERLESLSKLKSKRRKSSLGKFSPLSSSVSI